MILESKKFGLRSILIFFEDDKIYDFINRGFYSRIIITSYNKLNLSDFKLRTKTTALIDLDQVEEDIFKKFRDTTRNEIRKTYKNSDLRFRFFDSVDNESYDIYRDFEYLQNRIPAPKENLKDCLFFGAYYKGKLISAIYLIATRPYLRIRSIFSKRLRSNDKELYKIISNSSRRLIWEICQWGKKESYKSLDMASVNFNNPKTANITRFKMSFGGTVVNEYTYTYTNFLYKLLEKAVKIKKIIFRLKYSFSKK